MAKTVKRIRRIHQAAVKAKRLLPLPRRVIYLRATNDDFVFEVPDLKVAEALLAMPEIAFSYQKLQRVLAAYTQLGRGPRTVKGQASGKRSRVRLPRQKEWRLLLQEEFDRGALQNRVTGFSYWDRLFPMYGSDLTDIPVEERIYLIAVVDTFLGRRFSSKFDSQASQ